MFSLNEIEAMGKRATHGAGIHWGIAEEAGKAIRWLAAHSLPGPELLAELLKNNESTNYRGAAPVSTNEIWRAEAGALSPLIAGAALSDLAGELAAGREFEFATTMLPLLVAPYVAFSAKLQGVAFELCWFDLKLIITPDNGLSVEGDIAAATVWSVDKVCCRLAAKDIATEPPSEIGRTVDTEIWNSLNAFAYRAFAPSTDSSRMGAGAGLVDND